MGPPSAVTTQVRKSKRFTGRIPHTIQNHVATFVTSNPAISFYELSLKAEGKLDEMGMPTAYTGYLTYDERLPLEAKGEQIALDLPAQEGAASFQIGDRVQVADVTNAHNTQFGVIAGPSLTHQPGAYWVNLDDTQRALTFWPGQLIRA